MNKIIGNEHILVIINIDHIICYNFYKRKNNKYINIYDFINYIKLINCKYLLFITHKIRLPLYLNYIIFKKIQT